MKPDFHLINPRSLKNGETHSVAHVSISNGLVSVHPLNDGVLLIETNRRSLQNRYLLVCLHAC